MSNLRGQANLGRKQSCPSLSTGCPSERGYEKRLSEVAFCPLNLGQFSHPSPSKKATFSKSNQKGGTAQGGTAKLRSWTRVRRNGTFGVCAQGFSMRLWKQGMLIRIQVPPSAVPPPSLDDSTRSPGEIQKGTARGEWLQTCHNRS